MATVRIERGNECAGLGVTSFPELFIPHNVMPNTPHLYTKRHSHRYVFTGPSSRGGFRSRKRHRINCVGKYTLSLVKARSFFGYDLSIHPAQIRLAHLFFIYPK